ncbi:hypothetical protein BpHYR1_046862 [Brachionus plicatilis]|uniref:Uncharacterized protein n=1 Tax=Brachionus plicatilis TaxID=10195 RepID=A0A3M7RG41_BRAPC|nr:hypothetical protein BpHYR1_046862 [Brachionus plicatilis]
MALSMSCMASEPGKESKVELEKAAAELSAVLFGGVKTTRHEHNLRRKTLGYGHDYGPEGGQVLHIAQRSTKLCIPCNVDIEAGRHLAAALLDSAGAGEKIAMVVSVQRYVEYVGVVIGELLSAVAMMHVPTQVFLQHLGYNGHSVKVAKAERFVVLGVRAWRSDNGKAVAQTIAGDQCGQLVCRADGDATRQRRKLFVPTVVQIELQRQAFARRHAHIHHVGLQVFLGQFDALFKVSAEYERVLLVVTQQQIADSRHFRPHHLTLAVQLGRPYPVPDGADAIRSFQMHSGVFARTLVSQHHCVVNKPSCVLVLFFLFLFCSTNCGDFLVIDTGGTASAGVDVGGEQIGKGKISIVDLFGLFFLLHVVELVLILFSYVFELVFQQQFVVLFHMHHVAKFGPILMIDRLTLILIKIQIGHGQLCPLGPHQLLLNKGYLLQYILRLLAEGSSGGRDRRRQYNLLV